MNVRLYVLQRTTAAVLAPMIVGHLFVILYATRNGLSAAEILGRTQGSVLWGIYYSAFVVAAAVHGAIGIRGVLREWSPSSIAHSARALDGAMWGFGLVLLLLGLRAVYAVIA